MEYILIIGTFESIFLLLLLLGKKISYKITVLAIGLSTISYNFWSPGRYVQD